MLSREEIMGSKQKYKCETHLWAEPHIVFVNKRNEIETGTNHS